MSTLQPLDDETWGILDELTVSLRPARSYVLTEQRNAWHSTLSSSYRGTAALHAYPNQAKAMAEEWRRQGTYFKILEVPCLWFLTETGSSLLITDFHGNEPFWQCRNGLDGNRNLRPGRELISTLSPIWSIDDGHFGTAWEDPIPDLDSILMGVADRGVEPVRIGEGDFATWQSESVGGAYVLSWTSTMNRYEASSAHRVARRFRQNGRAFE